MAISPGVNSAIQPEDDRRVLKVLPNEEKQIFLVELEF